MTTTLVRLPIQDRTELIVLFLRVPAGAIRARRFAVGSYEVRLSDPTRNDPEGYRLAKPLFTRVATVTAELDRLGWGWRRANRTDDGNGNNPHFPNPYAEARS